MNDGFVTRDVAVDGVRSPVVVAGHAADPRESVVYLHGNNAGAGWGPLLVPVASFARAIAPDLPGFGDADKPAHWPYTVAAYADHLSGVLDESANSRPTWWHMTSAGRSLSRGRQITWTPSAASP